MKALDPKRPLINYPAKVFLRDIITYVWPYRKKFILSTVIEFVDSLVWLYPPIAIANIINFFSQGVAHESYTPVWIWFGLFALISVVRPFLSNIAANLGNQVSEQVAIDIELAAINRMAILDIAWHERENTGNKIQRADIAGRSLRGLLNIWQSYLIEVLVNMVAIPIILIKFDIKISAIIVFVMVARFLISRRMISSIASTQHQSNIASENLNGLIHETVGNVRTLKVMGGFNTLSKQLRVLGSLMFGYIKAGIHLRQIRTFIQAQTFTSLRVILFAYIIYEIMHGRAEIGLLALVQTYLGTIAGSVDRLADATQEITVNKYGMARVRQLFDEPVGTANEEGKVKLLRDWKNINVTNLSFQYGENEVLSDLDFKITRGEKIGIVGLSGAGKSTLFKLLLKEYEDYRGVIEFDGQTLREISPKDYYNHTAVVLQDTEVFNFSLKENITIGKEGFDKSSFLRALEISHVNDFLYKLPKGVDTVIGEKGVKLSGGEKQRLGIARAVYKAPELLLMDEATSHLDIESEKAIQESLHQFFETVTAIVIAHRLTTIKEMDRIIVIEGGKIIEQGSFSKLMKAKGGRFRELWKKQKI